jgi:hypothetical protein
VVFEVELVFEGPDDRFDALTQPVREGSWGLFVPAGRVDEVEVQAGEERFDVGAGQALVGDDGAAGLGSVGRLVGQGLAGLFAFTGQFGVPRCRACARPATAARPPAAARRL